MAEPEGSHLLRGRGDGTHARVTFIELFFDLVFVFAITQLSHGLLHHLTLGGAAQTLLLLLAVWWVWIFTSWVTNWLDPEAAPVRLMLFALMLAGLVMSASIPKAFEERGLLFAGAYVTMQVGRSLFTLWAVRAASPVNYRNFQRITAWLALSGVLWLAGGLLQGEARFALWLLAMLLEFISPALGFWTPGLGRSRTADWDVSGAHMAERCGLFVILALGESILITGSTFAELSWSAPTSTAFAVGLAGSIAMWWIYFNIGAERATRLIEHAADPGRIARLAYTYLHVVIVAGIIVAAVADELAIKHPVGRAGTATALVTIGGPMLFLAGCLLFKWSTAGWPPLSHMAGIAMLVACFLLAPALDTLALASLASAVLVLVAGWETLSLAGSRERRDTAG
ncbi:MAG: low temperature requirement protein A [Hyphomicrobiaceae bacterium]|nr:low temperature requirement protein A [Hyphomicrobiaceae bacterium]